jgi:hypothetical protein
VVDVNIRQPAILKVLANQSMHEFDAMDNTALITEKGITELFEDVLVIFICSNVICPNKGVEQGKMDQLIVDR